MKTKTFKKTIPVFLLTLLAAVSLAVLFTACSSDNEEPTQDLTGTYTDYIDANKTFAVQAGDVYGGVAWDIFRADAPEYNAVADMLEAVRMGRVDAALLSHSYVIQLQISGLDDDFAYLWIPEDIYVNKAAPVFHTEELRDKYNEWFTGIAADGTWQRIVDFWINSPLPAQEDIPQFEFAGENGVLRVADTGNYPPLIYFDANNELAGFDVEIVSLFAIHMGMKPEFSIMSYDAIIPYIISGRADMSAATVTVTDEREEGVIFGEPSVITQAVLIVPKSGVSSGRTYVDFEGKRIGVLTGGVGEFVTADINAIPAYYSEMTSGVEDVRQGRIDGFMNDLSIVRTLTAMQGNENLQVIEIPAAFFSAQSGAISLDQDIIDRFNVFLANTETDGTLSQMRERWLGENLDLDSPMPDIPLTGENGMLRVATTGTMVPFDFHGEGGQLKGFCIELTLRFAQHEGMNIEFDTMDFAALIPSVVSGKADLAITNIFITEERKQSVLFTNSFYEDTQAIITLRESGVSQETTGVFIEWLQTGIERNLLTDNRWKMIVDGLGVTMTIAFFAQLFGTLFGAFVCWLLMRKNRFVRWFGSFYCGVIHGTPIVVLLMITYYIIFGGTQISGIFIAVAAFTMVMGANVAQNLKGAIDTVDPVEIEAARSIGFPAFKAFLTVTLPQAVRRALPGYTNGFVELVKATAIVGFIAVQDLTRAGDIIRSRTYDAYFPLLFIAVIYLIVTTVCVQLFKFIVKRVNGGVSL